MPKQIPPDIEQCPVCLRSIDLTKTQVVYRLRAYHTSCKIPTEHQIDAGFRFIRTIAYSAGDTLEYEESIQLIRGILQRMGLGDE